MLGGEMRLITRKISLDSKLEMLYNGYVENDIMISFST